LLLWTSSLVLACGGRVVEATGASSGGGAAGGGTTIPCEAGCAEADCSLAHLWSSGFNASGDASFEAVAADHAGGLVAAGLLGGTIDLGGGALVSPGGNSILVARFDARGAHRWSRVFGNRDFQGAMAVGVDSADNVVIGGFNSGSLDFGGAPITGALFLAKLDADGQHVWSRGFPGDRVDSWVEDLAIFPDGSILLAGTFSGTIDLGGGPIASTSYETDAFVARYDAGGGLMWGRQLSTTAVVPNTQVVIGSDDSVYVAAEMNGTVDFDGASVSGMGAVVAKLSATGAHVWSRALTTDYSILPGDLAIGPDEAVVLTGVTGGLTDFGSGAHEGYGAFLAKYAADGSPVWSHVFGPSYDASNWGVGVRIDDRGDIFMLAQADQVDYGGGIVGMSGFEGEGEVAMARFDGCGTHLWSRSYGPASSFDVGNIDLTPDDALVIAGGLYFFGGPLDFGGDPIALQGDAASYIVKLGR
jgi:uncharacterized protein (AIM24 family)